MMVIQLNQVLIIADYPEPLIDITFDAQSDSCTFEALESSA